MALVVGKDSKGKWGDCGDLGDLLEGFDKASEVRNKAYHLLGGHRIDALVG